MPAYTTETVDTSGRRQVIATVLLVVAALVTSYLPTSTQERMAAALRSTVLRPFVSTQETLITARARAVDAGLLEKRVDSLVAAQAAEGSLEEENRRLRALLRLSDKLGAAFAAATVVRPGTAGSESTFLVDVGERDGIQPNSPVLSSQGILGIIRVVQPDHSIGMDWSHPDFRAFAMSADGATYGVVEARRGRFREEDRLVFNGTAFHTRLEDGTVIVTSGLGGVFPRGVPIGLIEGLAESEGGWRKSYWLRPLVEPGLATHVLVAVGTAASPGDLSPAFPADSVRTEDQIVAAERARDDSLRALADTVALLREAVAAYLVRDSLRAHGLAAAQADSVARRTAAQPEDSGRGRGLGAPPQAARPTAPAARAPVPPPTGAPGTGGAGGEPRRPVIRPALDTGAPARIRPADTVAARRRPLPVPTDTIRLGAPAAGGGVRPDTSQEGERDR